MAKKFQFSRTTISIPGDLKRRMDKAGDLVNWSAVASLAFEAKLGEIATKKEKKNMDDVIARLRKSKQETASDRYKEGVAIGEEWVKDHAEASELQRLEREWEASKRTADERLWLETHENSAYTAAELLPNAIRGQGERTDRDLAVEFWATLLGDDTEATDDPDFLRGFIEGALELWQSVKTKL